MRSILLSQFWSRMLRIPFILVSLTLIVGLIYVTNAWSPSSYAIVLRTIGAEDDGLVLGTPRPIRSDEWSVLTPFTQIAASNPSRRYYSGPFGTEDLRNFLGLPLIDWGLLFKPAQWLYALAGPAYAYSFSSYFVIATFILGYFFLFARLAIAPSHALLLSLSLFFTGFVQFWWTLSSPAMAYFPWILIALMVREQTPWRVLCIYWIATCWLVSVFYPPFFISLAWLGAVILLGFGYARLDQRKHLVGATVAIVAANITAIVYLWDYLHETIGTLYPGERTNSGGGVGAWELASHLVPNLLFTSDFESLLPQNICRLATVGSLFLLCVVAFLDYRRVWDLPAGTDVISRNKRRTLLMLGGLVVLMTLWMTLPIPESIGRFLLWHRVPGERMKLAAGMALILAAYLAADLYGLKVTVARYAIFAALYSALSLWGPADYSGPRRIELIAEALPLVYVGIAITTMRFWRVSATTACLAASVVASLQYVARFNPVQSAHPIFAPKSAWLDGARDIPRTVPIAFHGEYGAILGGLGISAYNHIQVTPQLRFWREKFPEVTEEESTKVFNRYARIRIDDVDQPLLLGPDNIAVPAKGLESRRVVRGEAWQIPVAGRGNIDSVSIRGKHVILTGWAPWKSYGLTQGLTVASSFAIDRMSIQTVARPDVVKALHEPHLAASGFILSLWLPKDATPAELGDLHIGSFDERTHERFGLPTSDLRAMAGR